MRSKIFSSLPLSWKTVNSGGSRKRPVLRPSASMKLPHLGAAVKEITAPGSRTEAAVRAIDTARRLCNSLTGARGGNDYEAGFATVFGWRRAADDFNGLDGVGRKLVGEDFALLVGDGLAVDGEGVFSVVAEAVEEAVGIRRNAGSGGGDEGAERGGLAFERDLDEEVAIDVGVEGG